MSIAWNEIVEVASKAIIATLEEGAQRGKDEHDVPEWENKSAYDHMTRAHTHLELELWGRNPEDDEDHLRHALTRIAMALTKLDTS